MAHTRRLAVIDIGSQSIRLVVFDGLKRVPLALYNEKMLCLLGKGLEKTGHLNPEGVHKALAEIDRFVCLLRLMGVEDVSILSTAAVRDAEDGPAFVAAIEARHHMPVQVLSGNREAELAGLAILSSMHAPRGVAGDLGGGSLELVALNDGRIRDHTTLPLGVLRLSDAAGGDVHVARSLVGRRIKDVSWLNDAPHTTFYAVGGSFRALAKMHMMATAYPLQVLHGYQVDAADIVPLLRKVAGLSADKVAALPGASSKRAASLPFAATVLLELIERMGTQTIIFSASGIREGYVYSRLSSEEQAEDGLIRSSSDLLGDHPVFLRYGEELAAWMNPLFAGETPEEGRLRTAACMLSGIAARIHPDHRAEWAFERMLYATAVGLTHAERVFIAACVYHRYFFNEGIAYPAASLVEPQDYRRARLIGTAARLAYSLTAGAPGVLPRVPLSLKGKQARLSLDTSLEMLMGEEVTKRLERLNQLLK